MISDLLPRPFNPRLTGVSAERHWPGGGGRITPPQANSQTNDRSETGEAALERSRRDGSKALLKFFLKGHVSGQGQVKGKNWAFQHFGSQNRQLHSNRPKLGQNTLKGQTKVLYECKRHTKYGSRSRSGHERSLYSKVTLWSCDTCFMANFGHRIRWLR